jgi:trimeric autotransporter adhesin
MTPSAIQFAPSISAASALASSARAFETNLENGGSFAAHLDQAVQSSDRPVLRPEAQPSASTRTESHALAPEQASDAMPRVQREPVIAERPATPQTKQRQSASSKADAKAQNADKSPVRKDDQKDNQKDNRSQPTNARDADARSSSNSGANSGNSSGGSSRNSGGRQTGEEETPANGKASFAQAVAQSAASQSEATTQTSGAQSDQASAGGDSSSVASIPAALLALLQGSQGSTQAVPVQAETSVSTDQNLAETGSSATGTTSGTFSNPFRSFNLSTAAAYQASPTGFQASAQSAVLSGGPSGSGAGSTPSSTTGAAPTGQADATANNASSTSSADTGSASSTSPSTASQTGSANSQSEQPSLPVEPFGTASADLSTTESQVNSTSHTDSTPKASSPTLPPTTSQADAAASILPATNQPTQTATGKSLSAQTADSANSLKNLKLEAGQQEAARTALDQSRTALEQAAKANTESVAAVLQQTGVSTTSFANHQVSPAASLQTSFQSGLSEAVAMGQDSGSPASTAQVTTSGSTDDSTEDSTGDDPSAPVSGASPISNNSKPGSDFAEALPSSAFNSDSVGGVAPSAVHAAAAATLQSNTGFDNASPKASESVSQSFNSAAQEKAFAAWQSVSEQVGRVVNTATLNALQNGTEMRVQLRTDAFGSMDIRATLEGGKVGAAIGVESAEAHSALLGQLPALQQSLSERQVQLDQISVVSSHEQSVTDFGTGAGKQNGDPTASGGYRQQTGGPGRVSETASASASEAWQPEVSRGRLSVRA